VVVAGALERGDQGGSNGGKISVIGSVLTEIWVVKECQQKNIFFKKKSQNGLSG
jgi:hypothetical protein